MQQDPLKPARLAASDTTPVARIGPPAHEDLRPTLGPELVRLEAERARLEARIEALEVELQAKERRQNQLIGERDQLRAQLLEHQRDNARLNREIGALRAPARRGGGGAWLRSLWARLAGSRQPAAARRPGVPAPPSSTEDAGMPALVPWMRDGPGSPILCVVLAGLQAGGRERALELVERQCRQRGMTPLIITDDDDFLPFRGRRMVVEYLPARAALEAAAPGRPAEVYLQRRLALLRRKWRPARIIALGEGAGLLVKTWQASPFETSPLPAFSEDQSFTPG